MSKSNSDLISWKENEDKNSDFSIIDSEKISLNIPIFPPVQNLQSLDQSCTEIYKSRKSTFQILNLTQKNETIDEPDDLAAIDAKYRVTEQKMQSETRVQSQIFQIQRQEAINLYEPADLELAKVHGEAKKVGRLNDLKDEDSGEKCKCCNYPVSQPKFELFKDFKLIGELGCSFPMYFKFIKLLIIIFTIGFFAVCLPALIDCSLADRYYEWTRDKSFNVITPANYGQIWTLNSNERISAHFDPIPLNYPSWPCILHIIMCIFLMIFYPWVLRTIKENAIEIDLLYTSPSDYTLMVKGLPDSYTTEELEQHILTSFSEVSPEVVNIICSYNIRDYAEIEKKIMKWDSKRHFIEEYNKKFGKDPVNKKCCGGYSIESAELCEKELKSCHDFKNSLYSTLKNEVLTPFAFVMFRTQIQARRVAEKWHRGFFEVLFGRLACSGCVHSQFNFKGNFVHAEISPEATDVTWENLSVSNSRRYSYRMLTLFFSLIVLGATFLVVYFTAQWKLSVFKNKNNESWVNIKAATILPSVVSVTVNIMIARLMRTFSLLEKHVTWSAYNLSVLNKLVFFMFLNSIVIPIIIFPNHETDWFSHGGLADSIFYFEVFNACSSPFIYLFNPQNVLKKYKRYRAIKAERKGTLQMSQLDANLLFEGPEVDLADRFAHALETFFQSFFFAPIVPIGVLIGLVAIILDIIIFNYMLLRVHTRPRKHGAELVIKAAEWIPWGILTYAGGIFVFYTQLNQNFYVLCLVVLVIAALYVFTPFSIICLSCFKDKTLDNLEDLFNNSKQDDIFLHLHEFFDDYERDNPVTSAAGWRKWDLFIQTKDPKAYISLKNAQSKEDFQGK